MSLRHGGALAPWEKPYTEQEILDRVHKEANGHVHIVRHRRGAALCSCGKSFSNSDSWRFLVHVEEVKRVASNRLRGLADNDD